MGTMTFGATAREGISKKHKDIFLKMKIMQASLATDISDIQFVVCQEMKTPIYSMYWII